MKAVVNSQSKLFTQEGYDTYYRIVLRVLGACFFLALFFLTSFNPVHLLSKQPQFALGAHSEHIPLLRYICNVKRLTVAPPLYFFLIQAREREKLKNPFLFLLALSGSRSFEGMHIAYRSIKIFASVLLLLSCFSAAC